MNLLEDAWIPVRANGGTGPFRQISYEELLCGDGNWQVSLPRDDLEMACVQLLICMTQVIFLPRDDREMRDRHDAPLDSESYTKAIVPYRAWFDLNHPVHPFMQTRGVKGGPTSVQKLLPGMPEKTSTAPSAHCFFNEVDEVEYASGAIAAIALFNQASNSPSFGGGFKGSLRGGSPITTLVVGDDLRGTMWRNVLTRERVHEQLPGYEPDPARDKPTWVEPIKRDQKIAAMTIGLLRGLFWQPAHIELVSAEKNTTCGVLNITGPAFMGFRKEKFSFTVEGIWPHPHGAQIAKLKKGTIEWKFASFTTVAPAWIHLSEFVVARSIGEGNEGQIPAAPILQISQLFPHDALHLWVGGYRVNQASVLERSHELFSLAQGWSDDRGRLEQLVNLGLQAKKALRGKLYFAVQGNKDKGLKGLGLPLHEAAEDLFYASSEGVLHAVLRDEMTFSEFKKTRARLATDLAALCRDIFTKLTDSFAAKPEYISVIAVARRNLENDLKQLIEGVQAHDQRRPSKRDTQAA